MGKWNVLATILIAMFSLLLILAFPLWIVNFIGRELLIILWLVFIIILIAVMS